MCPYFIRLKTLLWHFRDTRSNKLNNGVFLKDQTAAHTQHASKRQKAPKKCDTRPTANILITIRMTRHRNHPHPSPPLPRDNLEKSQMARL